MPIGPCSLRSVAVLSLVLLLAACASSRAPTTPRFASSSDADADGPPLAVPPGLADVPNAVPRVEPLRAGGPNKPYEVGGRLYVPIAADRPMVEQGGASWYGRKYHGRPTSSGELYDMFGMSAAHPTMPIPSFARVTNPANGRQVIVRVNDRGPFVPGRVIDLSYTAALAGGGGAAHARHHPRDAMDVRLAGGGAGRRPGTRTFRRARRRGVQRPPVTSIVVPVA